MLTLEKDDTSVPVVGIYHKDQRNPKKPMKMVHFTHNVDDDRQNVADAEGVLQLHKQYLKKRNLVNDDEFAEIGRMLDEEIEPSAPRPVLEHPGRVRTLPETGDVPGRHPGASVRIQLPP